MKKQKNKYYSLKPILERDCVYNMIIGERSNGKTYSVLKYSLMQYVKTGGQFAYVRRWKEDVIGRRASEVFSALINNDEIRKATNNEYTSIYYFSGKYYLCNYDEKTKKPIYNDGDCIGYTFSLSDMEHNKSISYPKITTIIFDEFLTKYVYLNDEFVLFMNTISTIVRQRTNVKIFMLGNTVTKYCPYFAEMGITHVQDMKQGDIDVYTYGDSKLKVAVEYCKPMSKAKANNFYFAFKNPKLHMITDGAWELNIYPHCPVKYRPKNIIFTYFILFNDRTFQCEVIQLENIVFTYIHEKTTPLKDTDNDLIYTLEYNPQLNYNRNITRPTTQLQERLYWFYKTERVYYQNNDVGDAINNYLKVCKGVTLK